MSYIPLLFIVFMWCSAYFYCCFRVVECILLLLIFHQCGKVHAVTVVHLWNSIYVWGLLIVSLWYNTHFHCCFCVVLCTLLTVVSVWYNVPCNCCFCVVQCTLATVASVWYNVHLWLLFLCGTMYTCNCCFCVAQCTLVTVAPEGRPGMSDVSPLYGISGLSFYSTLLSPLLIFCLVLLPFPSYLFLPAGPFFWTFSRKFFNIFREEIGFFVWLLFSS